MSLQPINQSKGGSLKWAWRIVDDYRANDRSVPAQKLRFAQEAIFNVTGRRPSHGTTYLDEEQLRKRAVPG